MAVVITVEVTSTQNVNLTLTSIANTCSSMSVLAAVLDG